MNEQQTCSWMHSGMSVVGDAFSTSPNISTSNQVQDMSQVNKSLQSQVEASHMNQCMHAYGILHCFAMEANGKDKLT